MKQSKKISISAWYGVIMTVLLLAFFLGVIGVYYSMVYSQTRQKIMKSGELSAVRSAEQIDRYLATGIDTMKLVGYALDTMIRDGRTQEEIHEYLRNQSAAVANITAENSPGIYGYINGEYIDGTEWVPDDDYVPTERPWYISARVGFGHVALVDPYIDAQSNTLMITISKTLCDAKSVAAMDFSIGRLQEVLAKLTEEGDSDIEIVLNGKYQVIAHSDPAEVGKDYLTEGDTLGAAIVRQMRASGENAFSVCYNGTDYIAYAVPVADRWFCLSVFNTAPAMGQLNKTLLFTLVAGALVVIILILIMLSSSRKTKLAQELQENLSQAQSDIMEKDGRIGEISRVAFRDVLTGLGSKAAFVRLSDEIAKKRKTDEEPVAVVMMDINNLKYVNDTFGHEAGDAYLRGCCKLMCDVFKHSPVFRTGGDEFVAVLRGSDYENRTALTARVAEAFAQSYAQEEKSPWERCSAAIGMSEAEPGEAKLDRALKRADEEMYQAKQKFKAKHGSYR